MKIKFVLPLLKFLRYSIIEDVDFEHLGADIVIVDKNQKPVLIIETKSWEQPIEIHLPQCLEYTLKLRTPYVMVTSGQHTALYSSLFDTSNLKNTKPIIRFSFNDLLSESADDILSKLYLFINKENLLGGATALGKEISRLLDSGKGIEQARKNFERECEKFTSPAPRPVITGRDFAKEAQKHPKKIYAALLLALEKFRDIAKESEGKGISISYRSRSIGLDYLDLTILRPKTDRLIEINPYTPGFAIGMARWRKLLSSPEIINQLQSFPRPVKDRQQIKNLVALLRAAIKELPVRK